MICPHCGKESEQLNTSIVPTMAAGHYLNPSWQVFNAACAAQPNTLNHMAINPNVACAAQPATITYITFGGQQ